MLPVASEVAVEPLDPALGIVKPVPGLIEKETRIRIRFPGKPGPAVHVVGALKVLDCIADLDHLGQDDGVVLAARDRILRGLKCCVRVLLIKTAYWGITPVRLERCSPTQLTSVAVSVARELREHRRHVTPHQAVTQVEDSQRPAQGGCRTVIERRRAHVVERLGGCAARHAAGRSSQQQ